MEHIPYEDQLPAEDEKQDIISPIIHSPPYIRKIFPEPAKCSKSNQGNVEIMEMLVSMRKELDEREKIWELQHKRREEFLEADFRRKEQQWEQILKQRDEEWKEEMEIRERELMKRMNTKIKTFYDEQLKRDKEVLSF